MHTQGRAWVWVPERRSCVCGKRLKSLSLPNSSMGGANCGAAGMGWERALRWQQSGESPACFSLHVCSTRHKDPVSRLGLVALTGNSQ